MAGSALSPSVPEILLKLQSLGLALDLDAPVEPTDETLGSLFDRIVSTFPDDTAEAPEPRPLPARLADGRPVDLLALFRTVRERGGPGSVSASQSWASVPEAVGLDPGHAPSLKLLYLKYLDAFGRWVDKAFDGNAAGDARASEEASGESSLEVDGSFLDASDRKKDYVSTPLLGSKKVQFLMPARGTERGSVLNDGDDGDGDCVIVEPEVAVVETLSSPKRKREALVGMLNWVIRVAKNPCHPLVKRLSSEQANNKGNEFGELFTQVLLAREAMFSDGTHGAKDNGSSLRKKQKMHPSFYEDNCGRARSSPRFNSAIKQSHSGSCSVTSKMKGDGGEKSLMALGEYSYDILPDVVCGVPYRDRHRILVGPSFQAEIPVWSPTYAANSRNSNDLKWCGTQLWPSEGMNKTTSERYFTGKGRQDACRCEHPGSVECVRFHISENRLQLNRELGLAFHAMGFDRMGEEVALSWTEEEERKFKAVVRLNPPSLQKNMWDQLHLSFPLKGTQNLVSYYFNVFLLRRRSYQNRVTPNSIDSDDEDAEIGFLSNPVANESLKYRERNTILYAQNPKNVDSD